MPQAQQRDEVLPLGSLPAESTFYVAVAAAEAARQAAYGAALTTLNANYTAAALVTFKTAIANADVAYFTAVNTARSTAAGAGLTLKTIGDIGPLPWSIGASLGSSI
jgi:hypothetical protein